LKYIHFLRKIKEKWCQARFRKNKVEEEVVDKEWGEEEDETDW